MPLEALLIPVNLTNSDCDGINGGTGCNFIFFIYLFLRVHSPDKTVITVPTTCSRPSIEMVGFIYLFMYVFLRVHSPDQTVIYY